MADDAAEVLLCDTSFVSELVVGRPVQTGALSQRLSAAVLAISVFTLMELRDGFSYAGWGGTRRARAESRIATLLLVPFDMPTVNRCAELRADLRRRGANLPDNDIWIAATALVRQLPLVSRDRHFDGVPELEHLLIR